MGPGRVFGMRRTGKALSIERLVSLMSSVKLEIPIAGITQNKADLIVADFNHERARHVWSSAGPVADQCICRLL
jgi:hypothetical protein